MSFIDLILKQDLILISLGFVLLPLFLAVGMVFFRAVRAMITRMKAAQLKRKQEKKVRRSAKPQPVQHFTDDPYRDVIEDDEENRIGKPLNDEEVDEIEEEQAETATAEATVTNAMQDILNDVFVDDGTNERVEILLSEAEEITAQDLADFAERIAERLAS